MMTRLRMAWAVLCAPSVVVVAYRAMPKPNGNQDVFGYARFSIPHPPTARFWDAYFEMARSWHAGPGRAQ